MRWLMEGVEVFLGRPGCERWLFAWKRVRATHHKHASTVELVG
jgi:hypothetical protein